MGAVHLLFKEIVKIHRASQHCGAVKSVYAKLIKNFNFFPFSLYKNHPNFIPANATRERTTFMNRSRSLSLVIQQHARCIRATIFPGFPTSSSHPFAVWQSVHPHCCWQRSNRRCGGCHAVHMVRFRPSPSSPATPSTCFRRKLQPDFRVSTKARENSYDVGLSLRCPKRTTTTTESVRE